MLEKLVSVKSNLSSDISTIIWDNFDDNFHFLSSCWSKTIEREKGRENENIMI